MKTYWKVTAKINGFDMVLLVHGTEAEMIKYMNSEIGGGDDRRTGNYGYIAVNDDTVETLKAIGCKAYLAPEIN